jgi:hypothetical protein
MKPKNNIYSNMYCGNYKLYFKIDAIITKHWRWLKSKQ